MFVYGPVASWEKPDIHIFSGSPLLTVYAYRESDHFQEKCDMSVYVAIYHYKNAVEVHISLVQSKFCDYKFCVDV